MILKTPKSHPNADKDSVHFQGMSKVRKSDPKDQELAKGY